MRLPISASDMLSLHRSLGFSLFVFSVLTCVNLNAEYVAFQRTTSQPEVSDVAVLVPTFHYSSLSGNVFLGSSFSSLSSSSSSTRRLSSASEQTAPPNDPYFPSQWFLHSEVPWDTQIDSVWHLLMLASRRLSNQRQVAQSVRSAPKSGSPGFDSNTGRLNHDASPNDLSLLGPRRKLESILNQWPYRQLQLQLNASENKQTSPLLSLVRKRLNNLRKDVESNKRQIDRISPQFNYPPNSTPNIISLLKGSNNKDIALYPVNDNREQASSHTHLSSAYVTEFLPLLFNQRSFQSWPESITNPSNSLVPKTIVPKGIVREEVVPTLQNRSSSPKLRLAGDTKPSTTSSSQSFLPKSPIPSISPFSLLNPLLHFTNSLPASILQPLQMPSLSSILSLGQLPLLSGQRLAADIPIDSNSRRIELFDSHVDSSLVQLVANILEQSGTTMRSRDGQDDIDWSSNDGSKYRKNDRRSDDSRDFKSNRPIVAVIDSGCDLSHFDLVESLWTNIGETDCYDGIDNDNNGYIDDCYGWDFVDDVPLREPKDSRRWKSSPVDNQDLMDDNEHRGQDQTADSFRERFMRADPVEESQKSDTSNARHVDSESQSFLDHGTHLASLIGSVADNSMGISGVCLGRCQVLCLRAIDQAGVKGDGNMIDSDVSTSSDLNRTETHLGNQSYVNDQTFWDRSESEQMKVEKKSTRIFATPDRQETELDDVSRKSVDKIAIIENEEGKEMVDAKKLRRTLKYEMQESGEERLVKALQYAYSMGARITTNSYGRKGKPFLELENEIERLSKLDSKGLLFVVAAGNEGIDLDAAYHHRRSSTPALYTHGHHRAMKDVDERVTKSYTAEEDNTIGDVEEGREERHSTLFFPAASSDVPEVLVVGASDREGHRLPFSNYGHSSVSLFAPGVLIAAATSGGGVDFVSGTSLSSPIVAGSAALLWSLFPQLPLSEIKQLLLSSSRLSPHLSNLCETGGTLDTWKAVEKAAERYHLLESIA